MPHLNPFPFFNLSLILNPTPNLNFKNTLRQLWKCQSTQQQSSAIPGIDTHTHILQLFFKDVPLTDMYCYSLPRMHPSHLPLAVNAKTLTTLVVLLVVRGSQHVIRWSQPQFPLGWLWCVEQAPKSPSPGAPVSPRCSSGTGYEEEKFCVCTFTPTNKPDEADSSPSFLSHLHPETEE